MVGVGAAFLEHLLEALEPHGRELRLHPPHVRRVLLGKLHGCACGGLDGDPGGRARGLWQWSSEVCVPVGESEEAHG